MFRLALKSVKHNPKRLILTAIAVALGVSLVAASHTFTHALSSGFSGLFSEIYSGTDVIVEKAPDTDESTNGAPFGPPEGIFEDALVGEIEAVAGVEVAFGGLQVAGSVLGPDTGEAAAADPFATGGAPSQIFNWSGMPAVDLSEVVEGRGPESNGEVTLDVDSIARLGYVLGDQVRIATDQGVSEYELVGSIRFGESNNLQGATLAFITTEDARALLENPKFQSISVVTADGADYAAVARDIQQVLPEGARAITGEDKA